MASRFREISLQIQEEVATQMERIEKKPLQQIVEEAWRAYVSDGRRQSIETKRVPVSWPLDWYEKMQTTWGRNNIPHEVRKVILKEIDTDPKRPLSPNPEWNTHEPDMTATNPKPLADRQSYVQAVMIPMDWYVRLLEIVGDGWVSTYMKFLVWQTLSRKTKTSLSVPQRLGKFME